MVLLSLVVAKADELGGGGTRLQLTNDVDLASGVPDPGVWIHGPGALGTVTVVLSTRFAGQEVEWSIGPLYTDDRELWVPLMVPDDVWVDDAQREWVTPLTGTVTTDVGPRLLEAALAWPDGLEGPPEAWDDAEQARRAPHGIVGLGADDASTTILTTRSEEVASAAESLASLRRTERGELVDDEGDVVHLQFAAPSPVVAAPPPGRTGGLRE